MSNKQQEPSFVVRGVNGEQITVTPSMLAGMPFVNLLNLREANQHDQQLQNLLANYEHRAFTREFVASPDSPSNPLVRALALGAATPAYSVLKKTGFLPQSQKGTGLASEASLEQVKQGMIGIGEGLQQYGADRVRPFMNWLGNGN